MEHALRCFALCCVLVLEEIEGWARSFPPPLTPRLCAQSNLPFTQALHIYGKITSRK